MRKLQKAAVVAAMLGSIGFIGAGTASAGEGPSFDITQSTSCKSHDLNIDILGNVGILNGVLGNALNGEGNPGAQSTTQGSSQGCNNSAF
ncbi:hypothetical protein ACFYSH_12295 [Streptomyces sp. NPDC005791]|jgi:hypothetical protein|uniref:hypothetical protein n=1 Tax=unclassified Streptomyces TaxID=2593676 RepID=UPI0033E2FCC0